MVDHKVLITTSGLGSRLGNLTDYTNKCLVRVADKPAISYIVESYPKDTKFIITLGHYGNHVRQFLQLVPLLQVPLVASTLGLIQMRPLAQR